MCHLRHSEPPQNPTRWHRANEGRPQGRRRTRAGPAPRRYGSCPRLALQAPMGAISTRLLYEIFERMFGGNKKCSRTGCSSIVTRRRAARRQQSEYAVVLTADSILARSTRRRQTSTGWNTAYIGANRHTLPPDEKPPPDDALHPMAFLVEKGPGAAPGRTSTKPTSSRWSLPGAARSVTMNSATVRCITPTPIRPMGRSSPGNRASGGSPCATAGTPEPGICRPSGRCLMRPATATSTGN